MSREVRRLLVALLLACSGVVWAQVPAHACKCASPSVEKQAARADAVFSGVLVENRTRDTDSGKRQETVYRIVGDRLYSGDLTTARVKVTSPGNSCGLADLPTDRRYLWFVNESRGNLTSDQCSGTARAGDSLVAEVEQALGEGTPLGGGPSGPAQEPAEFTPVVDGEPESLSRLAAPGAALVLVGLLGLFVVRWRTRRD